MCSLESTDNLYSFFNQSKCLILWQVSWLSIVLCELWAGNGTVHPSRAITQNRAILSSLKELLKMMQDYIQKVIHVVENNIHDIIYIIYVCSWAIIHLHLRICVLVCVTRSPQNINNVDQCRSHFNGDIIHRPLCFLFFQDQMVCGWSTF